MLTIQTTVQRLASTYYPSDPQRDLAQAASSYVDGGQSVEHADSVLSNSPDDETSPLSDL